LFYFHLDKPEKFQQLYELFARNNLYQDLLIAKNFIFFEKFKQPLVNGLELSTSFDGSLSFLISQIKTGKFNIFEVNDLLR
jgi:hypothetical protein